jgi:DNA ligase-1
VKGFTELFFELDHTTKSSEKVALLCDYFRVSSPEDCVWTLFFLLGRTLPRSIKTTELRELMSARMNYPLWLVEECYDSVGDLAETLALLNRSGPGTARPLSEVVELLSKKLTPPLINQLWDEFSFEQSFLLHKLITGGFRVGVSRGLVTRAVAQLAGVEPDIISHRLMGEWSPDSRFWQQLISGESSDAETLARPFPFLLAVNLEGGVHELGDCREWYAEWKWDGIRAQLVRRDGRSFLWSRSGENLTEQFPELIESSTSLPDGTVLDGEILGFKDERPLPFNLLQTRITRKKITSNILRDVPARFIPYDILEHRGSDIRELPLAKRREVLLQILAGSDYPVSPTIDFYSWEELAKLRDSSRERMVEGLVLKQRNSPYGSGRIRGCWIKWKIDPLSVDAVLIYAQRGHGRRANLFTDYTFALWHGEELVPFAKAYSGLTDAEIIEVDRFVREHTLSRFGPVRSVKPEIVCEISFEGVNRSNRHRSGLTVRFPRITRLRRDKSAQEADNIETLKKLSAVM